MLFVRGCLNSLHAGLSPAYLAFNPDVCDSNKLFFSRMKPRLRSSLFLALAAALAISTQPVLAKTDAEQVAISVGRLLEEGHYTHQPLTDEISKKFLRTYLELLDFIHLFLTQQDVDTLNAKYG